MKKTPHILAVGLIAFSCLTFPQEAKSEPLTAIFFGALWTYAVPGGLAAVGGYAAWLKVKEHLVNKKLEEVNAKVEAGFAEAAHGRMQINSRLDGQRDQLGQMQGNLSSLTTQVGEQHQSVLVAIQASGEEAQRNLTEAERRQQESQQSFRGEVTFLIEQGQEGVTLSFAEIMKIVEEAKTESKDGLSGLGAQFTVLREQLAEDQKKWGKVSLGIQRIDTRVKSQSQQTSALRTDVKNLQKGASQVMENVSRLHAGQAEILKLLRERSNTGRSQRTSNPVQAMAQRFMFLPPAYLIMQAYQQPQPFTLPGFTHERHVTLLGSDSFSRLAITTGD